MIICWPVKWNVERVGSMKWLRKVYRYIKGLFSSTLRLELSDVKIEKSSAPAWYLIAEGEIGVREIPANGDNARIVAYHGATNLGPSPDSVPWCSSFVNWCMREAGLLGTTRPNARSWLTWGYPMKAPELGAVAVFWRVRRDGWQGHVGFYVKTEGDYIYVLGGNQSDEVCIQAYHKSKLLGYRWPKS